MRRMPTAQEIAEFAVVCATDAVDRLVEFIGDDEPDPDDTAQPETILIQFQEKAIGNAGDRRTWEYISALNLVIGARAVRHPWSADTETDAATGSKAMWRIELFVES